MITRKSILQVLGDSQLKNFVERVTNQERLAVKKKKKKGMTWLSKKKREKGMTYLNISRKIRSANKVCIMHGFDFHKHVKFFST